MTEKKTYITMLNVVSCLSVLFLHTSGFWGFGKTRGWVAANFIECVFYFAVPIFIMISGVTLIDYRDRCTTAEYFKKRIKKTVIPFFFWSLFGLFFLIWRDGKESVSFKPTDIVDSIINCKYLPLYYFFLIIFGIYLALPMIGLIPKEKRKKALSYCILVAVTVNTVLPFLTSLSGGKINHNPKFVFPICNGYLQYALIGYYLDKYELSGKLKAIIYILGISGLAVHFFGTWYLSFRDNSLNSLFKGYTNVPCVFYSTALFLLFKDFPFDKMPGFIIKSLSFFSGQTFGIYLIHIQLMTVASKCFNIAPQRFLLRIIYAVVLFAVSGLTVRIIQKTPVLKHIVP